MKGPQRLYRQPPYGWSVAWWGGYPLEASVFWDCGDRSPTFRLRIWRFTLTLRTH